MDLLSTSIKCISCIFLYRLRISQGCRGLGSSCFDKNLSMNLYCRWILFNMSRIIIFVSHLLMAINVNVMSSICTLFHLLFFSLGRNFLQTVSSLGRNLLQTVCLLEKWRRWYYSDTLQVIVGSYSYIFTAKGIYFPS